MSVQFILEEIMCTIKAHDKHSFSAEATRDLIAGCVRAVAEIQSRAEQVASEKGLQEPVGLQGRED